MKKHLFGSTAIAALMAAPVALADDSAAPVINFSGFYTVGVIGQSVDNNNASDGIEDVQFYDDAELQWGVKYDVESLGVTIGHRAELSIENNTGLVTDESWAYVSGNFGQFQIGENDGAADQLSVTAFFDDQGVVGMDADAQAVGAFNTALGLTSDNAKVSYFTPKLGGMVQAGVSYTTVNETVSGSTTSTGSDLEDIVEFGVNLDTEIQGFAVAASFGIAEGEQKSDTAALSTGEYGFGATVGYAGFTVGGSYSKSTGENNVAEPDAWQLGAEYANGPWAVGVNYGEQDSDSNNGDTEVFGVGASYALAEAVSLAGGYQIVEGDSAASDASITGVSLSVKF